MRLKTSIDLSYKDNLSMYTVILSTLKYKKRFFIIKTFRCSLMGLNKLFKDLDYY